MARAKKKKKKYAVPVTYWYAGAGFVLGFLVSTVLFIVLITYPIQENRFLDGVSYGLRASVDSVFNWGRKEAYGRVDAINDGMLTLTSHRSGITRVYHVRFDDATKFYMFAPDAELSEVLLTSGDIKPGEYASITTEEPIGSKKEQKIISVLIM
ncbi:MAG: hypothetical protein V4436_01150 [Patescibacteria group bacterium]